MKFQKIHFALIAIVLAVAIFFMLKREGYEFTPAQKDRLTAIFTQRNIPTTQQGIIMDYIKAVKEKDKAKYDLLLPQIDTKFKTGSLQREISNVIDDTTGQAVRVPAPGGPSSFRCVNKGDGTYTCSFEDRGMITSGEGSSR